MFVQFQCGSVTRTVNSLNELGISVNSDDVVTKMLDLHVFFSSTRIKAIVSQRKGSSGADDVLKVKWPCYEKLFLLSNNVTPR